MMTAEFPGDLHAPANARFFVAGQLDQLLGDRGAPWADDIVLIVSELVTNSVRAGAGTIAVRLSADDERVDIEVTDDASGWPRPRTAKPEDQRGRGLSIVERLADSWTTTAGDPGKTVTATWFR